VNSTGGKEEMTGNRQIYRRKEAYFVDFSGNASVCEIIIRGKSRKCFDYGDRI
jgi:hypothetical protein